MTCNRSTGTHMVLAMTRPWKHPDTGIYWFRKRVPLALQAKVAKTEEKFSLKTRDPAEAKRLHALELAKVEERWANLAKPLVTLSELAAKRSAEEFYVRILERYQENPSHQTFWDVGLGASLFSMNSNPDVDFGKGQAVYIRMEMQDWCGREADLYLTRNGLQVDLAGRKNLVGAIARAVQAACLELRESETRPYVASGIAHLARPKAEVNAAPVELKELFAGWAAEKQPTAKTKYMWSNVVDQLIVFLGHSDASRVAADDILAWKNEMVAAGLSVRTIKYSKLAAVNAMLQWAVHNRRIAQNVASGTKLTTKIKPGEGIRGYSDEEAKLVLTAARKEKAAHLRWAPWLCAYSGARLSEICQLRRQDVVEHEGIWIMKIMAEAGSLKNANSERVVPIHPALVSEGFITFVEKAAAGPLFGQLSPDRFGNRGGNGTKVIGRWVRDLGLKDVRISPTHSWRHRFKTLARRHGLAPDLVSAIVGHGQKNVADAYGEYPLDALARELQKLPTLA
jgi:integrase